MEKENRRAKADKPQQGKLVAIPTTSSEIYQIIAQELVKYRKLKNRENPMVFMVSQGGR